MKLDPITPEQEAEMVRLAEDPAAQDTDALVFLSKEGWRHGRTKGPPVATLFYYYRLHGGLDSGIAFCRALSVLGFRRIKRSSMRLLLHSEDARVLNLWARDNPTPERMRQSVNASSRPSLRRPPELPGSPSSKTPPTEPPT